MRTFRRQRVEWLSEQLAASQAKPKLEREYSGLVPIRVGRPRRNKKCGCGSGKKHKHCCKSPVPILRFPFKRLGTPTPDKNARKLEVA